MNGICSEPWKNIKYSTTERALLCLSELDLLLFGEGRIFPKGVHDGGGGAHPRVLVQADERRQVAEALVRDKRLLPHVSSDGAERLPSDSLAARERERA